MWETLDDIDWSAVEHNYGSGEELPDLLRACRSGDEAAAFDLENGLYHQGGWVPSAATAALPFLVDVAFTSSGEVRETVMGLLGLLSREAIEIPDEWVDPGWPVAFGETFPRLAARAADDDPTVRRAIVDLAGAVDSPAGPRLLVERFATEPDPSVRLAVVEAAGRSRVHIADAASRDALDVLIATVESTGDAHARYAALLARIASGAVLGEADVPTVIAALHADDIGRWSDDGADPATGALTVARRLAEVVDAPGTAAAIVSGVGASALGSARTVALDLAASAAMRWRSVTPTVAASAIAALDSDDAEHRGRALHLLGCLGRSVAVHADAVARLLDDVGGWRTAANRDIALWALARFGDRRALPRIVDVLARDGSGFGDSNMFFTDRFVGPSLPSRSDLVTVNPEWIDDLLPTVRIRLRGLDGPGPLAQALSRILMTWGPSAMDAAADVAAAFGATGEPSMASALAAIAPLSGTPFTATVSDDDRARRLVAMARFRVTGDPSEAYPLIASSLESGDRFGALEWIAEFGPTAAGQVPILTDLLSDAEDWARARAAFALWSITGTADDAALVLTDVLGSGTTSRAMPVARFALDSLASMGASAAPAVPIVQELLDRDDRLAYNGGWRLFVEDEEFRAAAERLITTAGRRPVG